MKPVKPKFGHLYWIDRLIEVGKSIEPTKYTAQYCEVIRKAWLVQPLTKLHYTVRQRAAVLNDKQQTTNA